MALLLGPNTEEQAAEEENGSNFPFFSDTADQTALFNNS